MPQIINRPILKALSDVEPGELFRMALRGSYALAVVLERTGTRPLLGCLSSPEVPHPFYLHGGMDPICWSFGIEWVIDPVIGQESFVTRRFVGDEIGVLCLDEGDAWLRFDPPEGRNDFDGVTFSILGNGAIEEPRNSVRYRQWVIWQTQADRDRPDATPLARFGNDVPGAAA
ncbi:MAG: hypothetical protein V7704_08140 [Aurantimonas endophytica]|uniref:hypothetical protein n=1 Tax=Aurantimonas endophytica TaxID=1522175 RepID=UPI0030029C39